MLPVLFPLVEKDHREHGGHHKVHTLGAEGQHRTHHRAKTGAEHPVALIQQGDEEHEPAPVHPFRRLGRTGDGKGLIAHGKDHIKAAQTVALVAFQHGKAVEQMPRLDHQRHQKRRKGRERAQQQACQHKFQRTAVHHGAHEHGHPHRQAQRLHINAVAHPQHKIARQHRNGLRCGGTQCPPYGALPPCQLLFGYVFHWPFPQNTMPVSSLASLPPINPFSRYEYVCIITGFTAFAKVYSHCFWQNDSFFL